MKISHRTPKFNTTDVFNVCCDVHKDTLYFLARCPGVEYSTTCHNRTRTVQKQLDEYIATAREHGFDIARVVCEPTGEYDRILLRTARRLGCQTTYVNTENVSKFRQIETNDNGKSDTKDPHVIASLAEMGRMLRIRIQSPKYMTLRKLGSFSEDLEVRIVQIKGRLNRLLVDLFCDYDMDKDFLYGKGGKALLKSYGCNPYRIVRSGYKRFERKMRLSAKGIWTKTIKKLWSAAESSVLHQLPPEYVEVLVQRVMDLYADYEKQAETQAKTEKQMIEILQKLREEDSNIPPETPHIISEKNAAKLLAETGYLGDFSSAKQLLRYGGLNLRIRESGKYQGNTKTSKKGRRRIRKVLGNILLPLVPRHKFYGDFYHSKRDVDHMCGNKAMVVVMRNFLKKYWGWYKTGGGQFNEERWFNCESQCQQVVLGPAA